MTSSGTRSGIGGKRIFPFVALSCLAAPGQAQTAPGTAISNRADVTYQIDGDIRRGTSNTATFIVGERLDVGVSGDVTTPTVIAQAPTSVAVTVTNLGSGDEALDLTVQPSAGVRVDEVAIDRDGDGRFDAAVDRPISGATPILGPGEALQLVAVVAATTTPVDGALVVAVHAHTGSGAVDQSFPGMGDDGGDAVVGRTGATASVSLPLTAARTTPTLVKQQTVRAPDGSARPVSGAVVTYTLVATLPAGAAHDARIEDPVPEGTRYVANSLTLDGAPLSDATDADAGGCDGRLVAVALGTPTTAVTRAVTFQVRLP